MSRDSSRNIVVTGAAQGLGLAYARRLVADGHRVILADVDAERVGAAAAELGAGAEGSAEARHIDLSRPESCDEFASGLAATYERIDGLVNNAAVFSTIRMKPFWELTVAEWDALMAVNLRGPWLLVKALLPSLRRSPSASVVNISSDSLWQGRSGYLHYVASKAGVYGMTHSMAHELGGEGIRVNAVSPGAVYTEVERATVTPEQRETMRAMQSLHRDATSDDLVGVVAFLLCDDSRWITGQVIHVNGGLLHR